MGARATRITHCSRACMRACADQNQTLFMHCVASAQLGTVVEMNNTDYLTSFYICSKYQMFDIKVTFQQRSVESRFV